MKTLNDVAIVINARVNSTRIKKKIIRPFANTTLLDNILDKVNRISICKNKYLASCEKEVLDIYRKHDGCEIKILKRSSASVQEGRAPQRVTFEHYLTIPERYVMSINICSPFVEVSTYESAIHCFVNNNSIRTLTSVVERNNIFFDEEKKPINIHSHEVSTQTNSKVYEMAHIFHIMDIAFFEKYGYFWNYEENNPDFYVIADKIEVFDIDENNDFLIAEAIYRAKTSEDTKIR